MEKGELISYVAYLVRGTHAAKFVPKGTLNVRFLERELFVKPSLYDSAFVGMAVTDGEILVPARCEGACDAWQEGTLVLEGATFYLLINGDGCVAGLRFIGDEPNTEVLENFLEDLVPEYERVLLAGNDSWYNTSLTYRDDRYFNLRKK